MIRVENLSLAHGLHHVSCQFPSNRLIGIIGGNGAGKSSLLKSVAGLTQPLSGEVYIDEHPLSAMNHVTRGQQIAYLGQDTPTHWQLAVDEVIALGAIQPLKPAEEQRRVKALARQFGIEHLLGQSMPTLSGGEKARVQLARCLMKDAPILLADEPIAALDPYYQIEMIQQLKTLSVSRTCIVVLHHLSLAYQYCDELVLLKNGEIIATGNADEVIMTENLATAFSISATINRKDKTIHSIKQLSV